MAEWKQTKIGEFLREREGRYSPKDKKLVGLERLNKIDFSGGIHLSGKGSKTGMIIVEPGDLVISGINVAKGAIAVYQGDKPITATIHYSSYKFDRDQIDIEYFKRFVKSQAFIQALEVRGGIKTEIKPKHFLPIEIDLPYIDEQREVVSFFRRVEDEIGELGAEISAQARYLDMLRQAVLQEAIEGKLTTEWRKQNPGLISGENHASKLLEKIRTEKDRLIKEGKIRKGKPLLPITDDEKPFTLPDGWVWGRLGEVGIVNPRSYVDDELEVSFSPMNLISEKYGVCPEYETRKWRDVKKGFTHFAENDVAVAKITPCFENSKACVFRGVINGYGAGTTELHVLRPLLIEPDYLYVFVKTSRFLFDGERQMTGVCGQKRVPSEYFSNAPLPLAPLSEQCLIIENANKLMRMIDELEKQVFDRKEQSELLIQSVLREAFNNQGGTNA